MQHANIKVTIFYEHLKQYLSRIFQHPTPKTQDLESEISVPRFITPTNSETTNASRHHIFPPVRRITCKLTSISQRYGIFILIQSNMNIATSQRQIQLFMAPSTKKQNPTTTIRQLPSNAYIFGNQLSRNIPT